MPPTVITAKNSGLIKQVEQTLEQLSLQGFVRRAVRGEDVPQLTSDLASRGRRVIGLTGDDLLEEWLAAGNVLDERLARSKRPWNDPRAIFGGPALCLIGAPDEALEGAKRIAICNKYRYLAERYILGLEAQGMQIERIYLSGALENVRLLGLADFIVDIVVTGSTMREAGLAVREMISRSDLAVLEARQ
jgi:ATP phosphoribosyltransferase